MPLKIIFSICLYFLFSTLNVCFAQQPRLVLPVGHIDNVNSSQFSPDGKLIVTASDDETAKIWESSTGLLLHNITGHTGSVNYAEFSPDGQKIISASDDGTAIVWNTLTGLPVVHLKDNSGQVYFAKFSPDNKSIVTASGTSMNIVWDANTGKKKYIIYRGGTKSIDFNNDGSKILVTSDWNGAEIFDVKNGDSILAFKETGEMICYVFSPDLKKVLTLSNDSAVKVWDIKSGKIMFELKEKSKFDYAVFSPDGKKVAIVSMKDTVVRILNANTWTLSLPLKGHNDRITKATFSPDSKFLITSAGSRAIVWDSENGSLLLHLNKHLDQITSLVFSPDGKKILTSSSDETARVWDAKTGIELQNLLGHTDNITVAAFSPDGKKIMIADRFNELKVWSAETFQQLLTLKGHYKISSASFSPDAMRIATGSNDGTTKIWDAITGNAIINLQGHEDEITAICFSPNGKLLVTASRDETAKIWDTETGAYLLVLKKHKGEITSAAFSSDSKRIVTGSKDGTAKVWDASSGDLIFNLEGFAGFVNSAEFTHDGKKIITKVYGANGVSAVSWNAETGVLETRMSDAPFFSSDGKIFISSAPKKMHYILNTQAKSKVLLNAPADAEIKSINVINNRIITVLRNRIDFYNLNTGEIVNNLILVDSNDYMVLIDQNFYFSTPNTSKLLHYVSSDLKVITFEQLDVKYNRPDKVLKAIGNSDTALITSYRKAYEKRIKKLGIDTTAFRDGYSVPEADFVNRDAIEYEQINEKLALHIKGNDNTYKLDRFNVWVNETPIFGQRGISLRNKDLNNFDSSITIKLSQGQNRIETSISNVNGTESYRMPLIVNYIPAIKQKEKTFFIGIGIDKFVEHKYNLQYSAKDIRDLAKKLKEKYGNEMVIDTLFNKNVTLNNVKALKKKLLQTTENDKVIIAYSGHGMLSKDYDYFLSTYAVNFDNPAQNGLPYDELENLLDSIPARKKLLLIDACHSGEVDKEELETINATATAMKLKKGNILLSYKKDKKQLGLKNSFELMQSLFVNVGKSTGAIIISAAAGTQFALESNNLKNGVFTYSILEAMNKYPTIKISELKKIVGLRVEELTNGLQKPTSRNETIALDWQIW